MQIMSPHLWDYLYISDTAIIQNKLHVLCHIIHTAQNSPCRIHWNCASRKWDGKILRRCKLQNRNLIKSDFLLVQFGIVLFQLSV